MPGPRQDRRSEPIDQSLFGRRSHLRPESELRIRLATADDAPQIIAAVNAAFTVETFLEGTRTDSERLDEMMHTGDMLIAEDGSGHLVASVFVKVRGARGYFGMLAVDSSRQGKGYGRRMVEAAEAYCRERGCEAVDITVLSLRPELLPFYRGLGYVESGTEEFRPPRPLGPGIECHCILTSKSLPPL